MDVRTTARGRDVWLHAAPRVRLMHDNRTVRERGTQMSDGSTDEAKGRLKEAAGDLTGDEELKSEGKVDRASGKAKDVVGGVADKAKDALRKD